MARLMPDKKHILNSITAIARRLGRAPSLLEFVGRAGISKHSVFRHYPRWNDAVRATGLRPRRLYCRPKDDELLRDWGETVRRKRDLPSRRAHRLTGNYEPRTVADRFGGWDNLPQAFRHFAKGKREWADVLALLPAPVAHDPLKAARVRVTGARSLPQGRLGVPCPYNTSVGESSVSLIRPKPIKHAPLKGRLMYGNPIDFRGLRHEPVNEQGVILLFGTVAKELGYSIEAVQKGFPDCEAMRQITPERWQRVHIEFEFESKNFRDHGHPLTGCDVIVCWRHNWDGCPKHIEVLELSTLIKSSAICEDQAEAALKSRRMYGWRQ